MTVFGFAVSELLHWLFLPCEVFVNFILSQGGDKVTGNYSARVGELSYCVTTPVSLS
jgi:hypothetical protein